MLTAIQTQELSTPVTNTSNHSSTREGTNLSRTTSSADRLSRPQPLTRIPQHTTPTTLDVIQQVERLISSVARLIDSVVYLLRRNDSLRQPSTPTRDKPTIINSSSKPSRPLSDEEGPTSTPECACPAPSTSTLGSTLSQSKEFLWKPLSDRDGKLAILLPSTLTGEVKSVQILTPKGRKVIETGAFSGIGNGERAHFRFRKQGGAYPDGAIVLITLLDGTKRHLVIKETNSRLVK